MKRLVQIALVVVLVLALALGMFQSMAGSPVAGGKICPNVGWNSRCTTVAFQFWAPDTFPNVGWNS